MYMALVFKTFASKQGKQTNKQGKQTNKQIEPTIQLRVTKATINLTAG